MRVIDPTATTRLVRVAWAHVNWETNRLAGTATCRLTEGYSTEADLPKIVCFARCPIGTRPEDIRIVAVHAA